MYRRLTFIALLSSCISLQAQHPLDSLKASLESARRSNNKATEGIFLSRIGKHYFNKLSLYDTALQYFRDALRVNTLAQNDTMIAANLNDIGGVHYKRSDFDSCLYYYNKARLAFLKAGESTMAAYTEVNLAMIYKNKGVYDVALDLALHAASHLDTLPPDSYLATCYNTLGLTYQKIEDYKNALEYHRKALRVRTQLKSPEDIARSLNNMGLIYYKTHDYDSALIMQRQALQIKQQMLDKKGSASTLHNIGDVLLSQGKPLQAKVYYEQSLAIKEETSDKTGMIITLNSLARCYLALNDLNNTKKYVRAAEELNSTVGNLLDNRRENLKVKVGLYEKLKDERQALNALHELMSVKDSLMNIETAGALAEAQTRYETEKKEQQIALNEQLIVVQQTEIKSHKLWISALAWGVVLLAIIAGLIYNYFRITRRNKRKVETLLKEVHHRVKNNLQMISSIISLQTQQLTDKDAIQAVRSNESRINAMALIHRKLYNEDHDRNINIKDYVTELIQYLVHTYGYHEKALELDIAIDDIEVDVDKAIPLGLILNELISNALKYAYVDLPAPALHISIKRQQARLKIDIRDNGIGLGKKGSITREGAFGIKMVNILIREMHGNLSLQSETGTHYTLNIPLS